MWLVRKGRIEDAKQALKKLQSKHPSANNNIDATVAIIAYTHRYEKESETSANYLDCFCGVDLRRTEITYIVWAIQNLSGSGFMGYSAYFFQQAGLNSANSFNIAMAQYGLGAVGTISPVLLITGCLGLASPSNTIILWVVTCMMIAYTFVYDMTVGPVCYALTPEIPSGRLRTRTVVLSRNLYNTTNIIMNIIILYMLNPSAWN